MLFCSRGQYCTMLIFGGLLLPVCRLVCSFGQFLQPGDVRGRVQYGIYCSPRVIYTYCPRTAIYYIPPWYGIYCAGGAFDTPTQWDTIMLRSKYRCIELLNVSVEVAKYGKYSQIHTVHSLFVYYKK